MKEDYYTTTAKRLSDIEKECTKLMREIKELLQTMMKEEEEKI